MLMRWLVNQYFRDAAEGKVRAAVSEFTERAISRRGPSSPAPRAEPTGEAPATTSAAEGELLPCDAAFIFALGIESGGLVDLLNDSERSRHAHGIEHAGKLKGHEVVIVEGGVGQVAAARATAETIKFYEPQRILSAGFGGGLTDDLRRGHLLIVDEVVDERGNRLATGIKLAPESLASMKGVHCGRLLTVDRILRDPAERRELASRHGALACDMETMAVAATCSEHQVPFMAIRIISDGVDDVLPPEIENLVAQKSLAGKLGAAAAAVMQRFSAVKDLWQLREDALKASDRLARFLVSMLEQLPPN